MTIFEDRLVNHLLYASVVAGIDYDGRSVTPSFPYLPLDRAYRRLLRIGIRREWVYARWVGRALRSDNNCSGLSNSPQRFGGVSSPAYPLFARSTATCLPIPLDAPTTSATCFLTVAIRLSVHAVGILGFHLIWSFPQNGVKKERHEAICWVFQPPCKLRGIQIRAIDAFINAASAFAEKIWSKPIVGV